MSQPEGLRRSHQDYCAFGCRVDPDITITELPAQDPNFHL